MRTDRFHQKDLCCVPDPARKSSTCLPIWKVQLVQILIVMMAAFVISSAAQLLSLSRQLSLFPFPQISLWPFVWLVF